MIRTDQEHRLARERLEQESERLSAHRSNLRRQGLKTAEVRRAMEPLESFHLQLVEEVESYERLQRGEVDPIVNLDRFGRMLIGLRIAQGVSQRELAERLGVHESQVSRDERNEYHGASLERANRVLDALEAEVQITVIRPTPRRAG